LVSFYLLVSIYAIKNSKHFAAWICNNANLNADINFALHKTELLFALFVGLGVYGLIKNLPPLLVNGYNFIKSNNSFTTDIEMAKNAGSNVAIQFATVFSFTVLIYYAKVFAHFAASKINNIEPVDAIAEKEA
jgi:hypothetical protein